MVQEELHGGDEELPEENAELGGKSSTEHDTEAEASTMPRSIKLQKPVRRKWRRMMTSSKMARM